jgi:hypothetical protein
MDMTSFRDSSAKRGRNLPTVGVKKSELRSYSTDHKEDMADNCVGGKFPDPTITHTLLVFNSATCMGLMVVMDMTLQGQCDAKGTAKALRFAQVEAAAEYSEACSGLSSTMGP